MSDVCSAFLLWIARRHREMLTMEQIEAAMFQKIKGSGRLNEMFRMEEMGKDLSTDRRQRDEILRWFVETQAVSILCDGSFPPWFQGFISRQEAEDQLRDKNVGCFLIRLSEKTVGYILSYKGQDRCRHFVINQTKTGLLIVSGDSTTHTSLTELINHFKTTPIQPFGEYLTSYNTEDPTKELYDVVVKPSVKSGVSVKALRSLWEQSGDVLHGMPPVLPSKSKSKLTNSTSIDGNSISQVAKIPPVPKKNVPLRNSLSAGFAGTHEQHSFSESWTFGWTGIDEKVNGRRKSDSQESEGFNSPLKWPENSCIPSTSVLTNPPKETWSNPKLQPFQDVNIEETQYLTTYPSNTMPSTPPQPPSLPLKTAMCAYSVLEFKKPQTKTESFTHISQAALQPNPLYQTSSGVCAGQEDQPEPDIPTQLIDDTLSDENPYQVIPDQRYSNTYEHIPELHESNTYEDIPAAHSNTYASVEEMQQNTHNTWGKKNHKWWKFRPENKRK